MKVLMVVQHINLFRNLETVVRELDVRGYETILLHGTPLESERDRARFESKKKKMIFMGRGIDVAENEIARLTSGYRPEPEESRQLKLRVGRQVINRGIYMHRGHPSPDRVVGGLEKALPPRAKKFVESRLGRAVLRRRASLRVWRVIEKRGPASERVTALLREVAPDVVLVSPTIWPKNPIEADYVFAARKLGIPTVGYLNSWDNLTSKGTVHVLPDAYIVWNEALAEEAEQIHLIPRRTIRITGAPHLDHFFDLQPSRPRAEICRALGCPDDGPYLVYLCSSRTLIADESHVVSRLADAFERRLGDRAPTIVVRPHPTNPVPWEGYERPRTTVYPHHGDQADTAASWQEYFDQLSGAMCFVGLNTTAFLEAAVADHPCLTVVSDEFFDQQGKTGHFRHLLAAGFLEVSGGLDEVTARVGRVLDGADENAFERRRFVERFLRPRGIEITARSVVADTIEEVAGVRGVQAAGRAPASDPSTVLS
jgi:hypothetical protein